MANKPAKPELQVGARFSPVSCSGFFIDPALVTAACLVLEKVHLLNDVEYAIEFAKHFKFVSRNEDAFKPQTRGQRFIDFIPQDDQNDLGITALTPTQLETLELYLDQFMSFCARYRSLFESVIVSDIAPRDDAVAEVVGVLRPSNVCKDNC